MAATIAQLCSTYAIIVEVPSAVALLELLPIAKIDKNYTTGDTALSMNAAYGYSSLRNHKVNEVNPAAISKK